MNRVKELDLVKSFTIIVNMIGIHTMCHLADSDVLTTSVTGRVLNVLATDWGAPVFMFCMGLALGFSHHCAPSDLLRRGIRLITAGMALNVLRYLPIVYTATATANTELLRGLAQIFNVDILQFAGLAFLLLALCRRLGMSDLWMLALSTVMNSAGTLLAGLQTSSYVADQMLGYFIHTPSCSCFPLLGWFIFVAAGNVFGRVYRDDPDRAFRVIIPATGVIAVVHQYLSITGQVPCFKTLLSDWDFYSMETPDAVCTAFGVAPFTLGVFRLIGKLIPDRWMDVISYPSRHINSFYCVSWVLIMWACCFLVGLKPAATVPSFILRWILITALTTAVVIVYDKWLAKRISPLFSGTAWTVGVWALCLIFGAVYFSLVPGPYTMPY